MPDLTEKLKEMTPLDIANIYKRLFDTPDGQLLLEDLKNRCYAKIATPFGEQGQRAEGMRSVLLHIESQLNYEEHERII